MLGVFLFLLLKFETHYKSGKRKNFGYPLKTTYVIQRISKTHQSMKAKIFSKKKRKGFMGLARRLMLNINVGSQSRFQTTIVLFYVAEVGSASLVKRAKKGANWLVSSFSCSWNSWFIIVLFCPLGFGVLF